MSTTIFRYGEPALLAWTAAYALWEPVSYFLIRATSKARTVAEYYDPARMPVPIVFFGDYIYSTFIFIVALQMMRPQSAWLTNLGIFIGVRWVSDLLFYLFISQIPMGTTRYLDFFKRYSKEVGFSAVLGDSAYGIVWLGLAQGLLSVPNWLQLLAIVVFLFGTLIVSY